MTITLLVFVCVCFLVSCTRLHFLVFRCHKTSVCGVRKAGNTVDNIEVRSRYHCLSGKEMSITYSECVCPCVRVNLCLSSMHSVCALQYVICGPSGCNIFFKVSHKQQYFREKILNIKCVF